MSTRQALDVEYRRAPDADVEAQHAVVLPQEPASSWRDIREERRGRPDA